MNSPIGGWPAYFVTGTVVLIISWALGGCRFGNEVETGDTPWDGVTGYYEARPQAFKACVTLSSPSETRCQNLSVNQIPSILTSVITQPVALQLTDVSSGEAYFFDPYGSGSTLPTSIDPSTKMIDFIGSASPQVLWTDSACTSQLFVEESGILTQKTANKVREITTSGQIEMTVNLYETYLTTCTTSLEAMRDCFNDSTLCGGSTESENADLQSLVQDSYGIYIDAGILLPSEFPALMSAGYVVSYQ